MAPKIINCGWKNLGRGILLLAGVAFATAAQAQETGVAAREQVAAGFKSRETLLVRLADAGFDQASFDDYLRRDLLAQRALASLIDAVPPPGGVAAAPAESRREAENRVLQDLRQGAEIKVLLPR